MVLEPASGKKCGYAAKNYSNNKDCKVRTPAHDCVDPCPNGTIFCRKLFTSYLPTYVNGLARLGGRSCKFCSPSPKHSQLAQEKLLMQSQYCLHNIVGERLSPSRIAEFSAKFLMRVTLRRHDRKTDQYMRSRKTKPTPTLNYSPNVSPQLRKIQERK
jgi:hypothetical protein